MFWLAQTVFVYNSGPFRFYRTRLVGFTVQQVQYWLGIGGGCGLEQENTQPVSHLFSSTVPPVVACAFYPFKSSKICFILFPVARATGDCCTQDIPAWHKDIYDIYIVRTPCWPLVKMAGSFIAELQLSNSNCTHGTHFCTQTTSIAALVTGVLSNYWKGK